MEYQAQCPKCKQWVDAYAEPFYRHTQCGYCIHPDIYDDKCRLCGEIVPDNKSTEG